MKNKIIFGHVLAFISVFIWSALYVSTKILLKEFSPIELLIIQFVIGYFLLFIINPKILKIYDIKTEIYLALSGVTGITLYNLFLNISVNYSNASNVSIIIATAPLFTAIFSFLFKIEKLYSNFFIGFIISIIGIYILSFSDSKLKFNIIGDLFAILSSISWGIYSIFILKINKIDANIILITRRIIFYGIIFILPVLLFSDFNPQLNSIKNFTILFNMFFVSFFASGVCFIIWNKATQLIGAIKTNIYVYLTPVITILVSYVVLKERITIISFIGIIVTLLGIILSERRNNIFTNKK